MIVPVAVVMVAGVRPAAAVLAMLAGLAAGIATGGADDGNGPGDDGAEQRQKDDRLIHAAFSPSSC